MSKTVRIDTECIVKLKGAPRIAKHGDIAMFSNHEVLFAPYVSSTKERYTVWGIRKYNVHLNKWSRFIPYPKRFLSPYHKITYNQNNGKLYIYAQYTDEEHITMVDIKTKKFHTITTNYRCQDRGLSPCMINANGTIHILASEIDRTMSKHCIFNNDSLSLQRIDDFPTTIHRAAMIFVPNKRILILFRWYEIWIYSLDSNKWRHLIEIENGCGMTHISAVLTADQKHVIIKGRKSERSSRIIGYIKILDIGDHDDYILREKAIRIKSIASSFLWKTSDKLTDEMLVIGYIKRLFQSIQFVDLMMPPVYIMQFIAKWYSEEMIHWVTKKVRNRDRTRKHFALSVKDILRVTNW